MKKITRHHANVMFRNLGTLALSHMDETTLTATLDNFDKCRRVQEDYLKLSEELSKRLYEGKDEKQRNAFFELASKWEGENNIAKRMELENAAREVYPEFYALYRKQVNVITQILNKEVEVDITEVDKDAFIKGILGGNEAARVGEIVAVFFPMFKEEEQKQTDLSELDELLK